MSNLSSFSSQTSRLFSGKQTPVVFTLLGFIAFIQLCYQVYITDVIQQSEDLDQLHDACDADAESFQCSEQRLYMGWQEESRLEEEQHILKSTRMTGHEDHHKAHVDRVVNAVVQAAADKTPETALEAHKSNIHDQIEAQHEALPADERDKAREIHAVHGDKLLDATLQAVHGKDSGESIQDIKQRMLNYQLEHERHRQERAEKLRKEHEERMLKFDKLFNETMAAIHAPTTPSPWAQSLQALQKHFDELQKKNDERRHKRQDARRVKNSGFLVSQTIRWQPVTQWKVAKADQNAGLVIAGWEDLHALKWSGAKPHVACIAMVPPGRHSYYRMMYFVDNWKLQDWESKELVLVYQHGDKRLANVVQKYVDGKSVKAVAARDGAFPSTAALRFGAWSVKADVIARWDFDEWHHPQQLTLQVKALAMTSRPASLLQPTGTHGAKATDREASLLGEAKWMREEWYPFLNHGSDVLEEDRAHHIVQVDVPKLDINAEIPATVPFNETMKRELAEIAAGAAICKKLRKGGHHELNVSHGTLPIAELEQDHEKLTQKHLDLEMQVGDLCSKADKEMLAPRRAELHRKVARLSSFEAELAKELDDPMKAIENTSSLEPLGGKSN